MSKYPTPYQELGRLLNREKMNKVTSYMKLAKAGKLDRSEKGFCSLKHIAYAMRDLAKTERDYRLLIGDLYLVAITHTSQLADLRQAIKASGSERLNNFVSTLKAEVDTSGMMSFKTPFGSIAMNTSTKNLASIALAEDDIYFANSSKGSCIMTRRGWCFDESFQPKGYKRIHDNLFVADAPQLSNMIMLQKALRAIVRS